MYREKELEIQQLLYAVLDRQLQKSCPFLSALCLRLCCLLFLVHKVDSEQSLNRIERKLQVFSKMFRRYKERE